MKETVYLNWREETDVINYQLKVFKWSQQESSKSNQTQIATNCQASPSDPFQVPLLNQRSRKSHRNITTPSWRATSPRTNYQLSPEAQRPATVPISNRRKKETYTCHPSVTSRVTILLRNAENAWCLSRSARRFRTIRTCRAISTRSSTTTRVVQQRTSTILSSASTGNSCLIRSRPTVSNSRRGRSRSRSSLRNQMTVRMATRK